MWFIKIDFWDEFQELINNIPYHSEIGNKILAIRAAESFCKQGKGISFYNLRVLDSKKAKEISKYKNDKDYREYNISDIK